MDLETENRIAAILLKEAAELRCQAQMEGTLAYLRQPTVRSRPNSRFLTATVLGVQQANRAVEVNEMWRLREKQLELDDRLGGKKDESNSGRSFRDVCESHRRSNMGCNEVESYVVALHSPKKRIIQDLFPAEDEGLRDDEMDEFLHSRSKRGRGAVGSRMDGTGPYLPSCPDYKRNLSGSPDEELRKGRVLLGPEKPLSLKYIESSDDEYEYESLKDQRKKAKKTGSSKKHSRKHKSKGKSKDKEKKRPEETKRKHWK